MRRLGPAGDVVRIARPAARRRVARTAHAPGAPRASAQTFSACSRAARATCLECAGVIPLYAHRLGRAYGPDNSRAALAGDAVRGRRRPGVRRLPDRGRRAGAAARPVAADRHRPRGLGARAHGRRAAPRATFRWRGADCFVDELLAVAPRDLLLQFDVKFHADPELATRTVEALAAVLDRAAARRVEVLSFASAACAARRLARAAGAARHLGRLRAAGARALGGAARRPGRVRRALPALAPRLVGRAAARRAERHHRNGQRRGAAAPRRRVRRRRDDDRRSRGAARAARVAA